MKSVLLVFVALFLGGACKQAPRGIPAEHGQARAVAEDDESATLLEVDTSASKIIWKGTKIGGWHAGEVRLAGGKLRVQGMIPVSGAFDIDMESIINTDIPDSDPVPKRKIVDHLKGPDFFNVSEFPQSTFQITSVEPADEDNKILLSGNLTIRGITRNITFLADIEPAGDVFRAFADFNIDRQEWGVSYRGAKDQMVHDQMNLKVVLVARSERMAGKM